MSDPPTNYYHEIRTMGHDSGAILSIELLYRAVKVPGDCLKFVWVAGICIVRHQWVLNGAQSINRGSRISGMRTSYWGILSVFFFGILEFLHSLSYLGF
jgi:hypothetical protein